MDPVCFRAVVAECTTKRTLQKIQTSNRRRSAAVFCQSELKGNSKKEMIWQLHNERPCFRVYRGQTQQSNTPESQYDDRASNALGVSKTGE